MSHFDVTLTDNVGASSTQSTVAVEGGATYTFSMSSFTGIDLGNISSIDVAINEGSNSVPGVRFYVESRFALTHRTRFQHQLASCFLPLVVRAWACSADFAVNPRLRLRKWIVVLE